MEYISCEYCRLFFSYDDYLCHVFRCANTSDHVSKHIYQNNQISKVTIRDFLDEHAFYVTPRETQMPAANKKERPTVQDDQICPICHEEMIHKKTLKKLECGHVYCMSCIQKWEARKSICPMCQKKIEK